MQIVTAFAVLALLADETFSAVIHFTQDFTPTANGIWLAHMTQVIISWLPESRLLKHTLNCIPPHEGHGIVFIILPPL
jgi:hypothetical protein